MYKYYKYIYTYITYVYIYVYIMHTRTCIEGFFPKRTFHGETFGGNVWGEVVVHGGTYDQIMSREGGAL